MKLPFRNRDVIRSIQPWICLSTHTLLLGFLLVHLQDLKSGFDFVLSVLKSLLYAIVFAYVLNLPMKHTKGLLLCHTKQNPFLQKKKRIISMILTFLLALILIALIGSIILPSITDSLTSPMKNLTFFFTNIVKNIDKVLAYFHIDHRIENVTQVGRFIQMPWEKTVTNAINLLSGSASGVLLGATSLVSSFVVGFTGFMFSLYLLNGRENFVHQMRKVAVTFLGCENSKIVSRHAARVNRIFSNFIGGQLTEACILWILYYILMRLFQFLCPELICTLITVCSMVPVFGPMFAMSVGAIMMLFRDPLQSVWFIIFYQILNYFEDNVIYPRVVGNSVGLPDLWVLLSILISGDLRGVFGMIITVSITTYLYIFPTEYVNHRLWRQGLIITEETMYQEDEKEHSA